MGGWVGGWVGVVCVFLYRGIKRFFFACKKFPSVLSFCWGDVLLFAVVFGSQWSTVPCTVEFTFVLGSRWSPRQCCFGGFTDVLGARCSSVTTLALNG